MMKESNMKKFASRLKKIAYAVGNFQARLLLAVLYFTVIMPYGVGVRFFADPLAVKKGKTFAGNWTDRKPAGDAETESKRQY